MITLKKFIAGLSILLIILIVYFRNINLKENNSEPEIDEKESWIEEKMKSMSLEEKIGQMLIVYDYSQEVDDELLNKLNEIKPGGFILFRKNFANYEQTQKLISDINSTSEIPMFISIDQEGGMVQRLKELDDQTITLFPSMYELGNTNDENLADEVGKVMGEELRVFNINMNFAPVLDIYSNPSNTVIGDRSFGRTAETVSKMALSFSEGLKSTGIIPVYKHFPGHGNTFEDSHDTLPIINKTKEELMELELKPFIDAIDNGAEVIMVGHLAVPKITGDTTPASLSRKIVTDLLKKELGFEGIVITDALNMGALTSKYSEEEIYINAINAGVDLLLMPNFNKETINMLINAINNGTIKKEEIDDSVTKILSLKYDYLLKENTYTREYLNSLEHQEILSKIKEY